MSYDLMAFDPDVAPRESGAFLEWCRSQTRWSEGHLYNDPAVTTARLSAWFADMRLEFPSMSDQDAYDDRDDVDDPRATDYSIGTSMIYAAFAWSQAESELKTVRALAVSHGVGFFKPSSDGSQPWFPPMDHAPDRTAIPGLALELEGGLDFPEPSIALIEAAVDWLDPQIRSGFLVLQHGGGSYVQVGGGKEACTVEWRDCQGPGFRHWVAGRPGGGSGATIATPGNGTTYRIRENERLGKEAAKAILCAFARGETRPADFAWRNLKSDMGGAPTRQADRPWWKFW